MQKAPSWITEDGKIHTEYVKALKHDVMLWLTKAGDNEVGAKKIVEALDETSIGHLLELLEEIRVEISTPSTFQILKIDSLMEPSSISE